MKAFKGIRGAVAFGCALLLTTTLGSLAQSVAWTNITAGGNWSAAGNWSPNAVPGSGTNVFLTNNVGVSYVSTNDILNNTIANLTVQSLVGAGGVTLINTASGFNPTGNVFIGRVANWNLNGFDVLVGGSMTISGVASRVSITNGASLQIDGNLFITNVSPNTATVTVDSGGFLNTGGVITNTGNLSTIQALTGDGVIGGFLFNNSILLVNTNASLSLTNGLLNRGAVTIRPGGALNVWGTDAASANSSGQLFTNAGTVTFTGIGGTLNASTVGYGVVNQGTLSSASSASGVVNAVVFNDTDGIISTATSGAGLTLHAVPTNMGTITVGNVNVAIRVLNGDVVNFGTVQNGGGGGNFVIENGSLINNSNVIFKGTGSFSANSTLNNGLFSITNTSASSATIGLGGPVTNNGTMILGRSNPQGSRFAMFSTTFLQNNGTVITVGTNGTINPDMTFIAVASPVSNQVTGSIIATNAGLLTFSGAFKNDGTILIHSNSVVGIGYSAPHVTPISVSFGTANFINDGTITLQDGTFGVNLLTNSSSATIQGHGDIGRVALSNLVSTSELTTNFVRQFITKNIVNSGLIAPDGVLNTGAITNLSGGRIIGFGTIQSLDTTNSYSGETLVTTTFNTGARIHNAAGATILANGGTLVLSDGLANNSNAGTLGASNGVLQLGNGTLALTNTGTIYVQNGGINIGDFRNNGTVQIIDSVVTWSNEVVNAGRYISDPSTNTFFDDVTVLPSGTLEGGIGDLFDFKQNLFINSTNTGQFNLVLSTVSFSGGGDHTNAITGLDFGWDQPYSESRGYTATNYAYGVLRLGPTDNLHLMDGDGNGANSNALYVGVLDIGGTTNNLTLLHTPFNIYYRNGLTDNAYLGGLTYALDGGGFLVPVPEPSSLLLVGLSVVLMRRIRGKR